MSKKNVLISAILFFATASFDTQGQSTGAMGAPRIGGGGSQLGGYTEVRESGRVPYRLYDIVLGRPTAHSMVASLVAFEEMEAYLEYGTEPGNYPLQTDSVEIGIDQPFEFLMADLEKDTEYYYQLRYKLGDQAEFQSSDQYGFHTPRSFASEFVFTLQADSHLDENTSAEVYINALKGALQAKPDFHLALGDAFMTDKYVDYRLSKPQYLAQRYYFGTFLSHSAPLFFALGNHDAESGNAERMAWSTRTRNAYFPNPSPNDFYSGNSGSGSDVDPVRNYYGFHWGNSLFVALDPFRYNEGRGGKGADNWYMTLGKEQYDWLVKTLSESEASFKFVYLHNLVGGIQSNRGGAEASLNFEWGGHEYDGSYTFDEKRPGWGKPIHDVLVENGVSVLFHGHDHMHIHQERDGLVYQLVSQPGHPSGKATSAEAYGYLSGTVVPGSGHLRVSVSATQAKIDFIDSRIDSLGQLLHSYTIEAVGSLPANH